jgi:hypothetical protein
VKLRYRGLPLKDTARSGRTTVLDQLAEVVARDDAPITSIARVSEQELHAGRGMQAAVLRDCLAAAAARHRMAELLGLDRLGGITQLGLGWAGCLCPGWPGWSGSCWPGL